MSHIEALDLGHAPRHLIVLGGGYVGLELAQAMRRFGSQVTIVERGKQLAGREDPDVGAALFELFKDEGIQVLLNTEMRDVAGRSGQQIRITLDGANGGRIAPPRSRAGRKSRRRNSRTVIGRCVGL